MTYAEYLASHKEFIPVYGLNPYYGEPEHQAVQDVCDLRARLETISFKHGRLAALTEALNQLPRNPAEEFLEEIAVWMRTAQTCAVREVCGEIYGHNKHIIAIMRHVAADQLDEGRQINILSRAYGRLYRTFHNTVFMFPTVPYAMFLTTPAFGFDIDVDDKLPF